MMNFDRHHRNVMVHVHVFKVIFFKFVQFNLAQWSDVESECIQFTNGTLSLKLKNNDLDNLSLVYDYFF